jgi:hypothetical protein
MEFSKLGKDAITEIVGRMSPKDVLSFCQTDKSIAQICAIDDFFKTLMRYHYPYFNPTNTPKKQYIALTYGIIHKYYISCEFYIRNNVKNSFTDSNGTVFVLTDIYDTSKVFSNDNDEAESIDTPIKFEVGGLKFPGQEIYLLIRSSSWAESHTNVFNTYEDAVNEFAYGYMENDETYYFVIMEKVFQDLNSDEYLFYYEEERYQIDFLGKRYLDDDEILDPENPKTKAFYKYIEKDVPCRDMTKRGIFSYMMKNGIFIVSETSEYREVYQIVKVTL